MSRKKVTPLILIGGIIICLFVIMSSYAYWQITQKQQNKNNMVAACVNFEMNGTSEAINLQSAWPLSEDDGRNLDGYTFTVTNHCKTDVNYVIALESLALENVEYLNNDYIALAVDDDFTKIYGKLGVIDNVIEVGDTETIRETREVTTATVKGNSMNEHTIRIWISEEAPISEQSKAFKSRVRITGGQGVNNNNAIATSEDCFTIDSTTGEITEYLIDAEGCGTSVVIPAKVDEVKVKSIDTNAFRKSEQVLNYDFSVVFDADDNPVSVVVNNPNETQNLTDWANENGFVGIEFVEYSENIDIGDGYMTHCNLVENNPDCVIAGEGVELFSTKSSIIITDLNLSKATYLETIEASAFSNVPADITDVSKYTNYETSLTALTFGNNTNALNIGTNAFARIDVEDLTLYTSYVPADTTSFAKANIDNLTMNAVEENTKLSSKILNNVVVNNLEIGEGIEKIDSANAVRGGEFSKATITTLTLPSTLNLDQVSGANISQAFNQDVTTFSTINTLVINTPITEISGFHSSSVKNFVIPETVETIGSSAFSNSKIESINLPEGLTKILGYAFGETTNLKNINIPSTIELMGSYAFYKSGLETITFENTVENPSQLINIPEYAFSYSKLKNLTIPSSIKTIGQNAFEYVETLKTLNVQNSTELPSQLSLIDDKAFKDCRQLERITLPQSLHTISWQSFAYTVSLNYLTIEDTTASPSNLKYLEQEAFYETGVDIVVLPGNIVSIGSRAFYGVGGTITIKKESSTGIELGTEWNGYAEVVYDPNAVYTG